LYQKAVVHISDGKDSQTVKDFDKVVEKMGKILENQNNVVKPDN
jgi:hypothetical protein